MAMAVTLALSGVPFLAGRSAHEDIDPPPPNGSKRNYRSLVYSLFRAPWRARSSGGREARLRFCWREANSARISVWLR